MGNLVINGVASSNGGTFGDVILKNISNHGSPLLSPGNPVLETVCFPNERQCDERVLRRTAFSLVLQGTQPCRILYTFSPSEGTLPNV
ncbi:hypothetical protein DWY22_04465 [Heyndrickxia coagulans]|nr:hypothetical protein DWY22_04465 [Heyndrickxia coagulans]RGR99450.1 hypothetical protein DWY16_04620 [Heyndrickxia coagulans]